MDIRRHLLAAAVVSAIGLPLAATADAVPLDPQPPVQVGPVAVDSEYADKAKLQDVVLGPMAMEPTKGDLESLIDFTTAGSCPWGSNTVTRIYGPGLPDGGQNVIGNRYTYEFGSPPADRLKSAMTITLSEVIARQPKPIELDGTYRILMRCQLPEPESLEDNFGVYEAIMEIHDGRWTAQTTLDDLPETPGPKAGPDAYAAWNEFKNAPAPPAPMEDPMAAAIKEFNAKQIAQAKENGTLEDGDGSKDKAADAERTASAADDKEKGNAGLAAAVAAGILAACAAPVALLRRKTAGSRR